jgi:hypothetical protein
MAVTAAGDATGLDVGTGDATPAEAPAWVRRQLARGVHRPVVCASAAVMGAVLPDLQGAGIARSSVRLLTAHYGAGQHICGPATCRFPEVPAADGTQWRDNAPGLNGTQVDESLLADGFFTPPPPPAAPAAREEPGMILVQVDRAEVPAGTVWPGVFLLSADATLHHVTGPEDGTDNVKSYQAAGIPGPVTITWAEYQARLA